MADFGGVVGLWLGATFISAIELLDLFIQILAHCCSCKMRTTKDIKENGKPGLPL